MSAQDARVVAAIETGVEAGLDLAAGPIRAVLGEGDAWGWVWDQIATPLEQAIKGGILAALDAAGVATGHVQITGGPDAEVGFEVLPPKG